MEYSKLGLEHFTPDYTRYFHALPEHVRDRLVPRQWQLHKGIDADTIAAIHDELYRRTLHGGWPDAVLTPGVSVRTAGRVATTKVELHLEHAQQGTRSRLTTDAVVLATGYRERPLDRLLAGLDPLPAPRLLRAPPRRRPSTGSSSTPPSPARVYVQNAERHTHGVGAPDLGLAAWRSATILNSLTGKEPYPLPAAHRLHHLRPGTPRRRHTVPAPRQATDARRRAAGEPSERLPDTTDPQLRRPAYPSRVSFQSTDANCAGSTVPFAFTHAMIVLRISSEFAHSCLAPRHMREVAAAARPVVVHREHELRRRVDRLARRTTAPRSANPPAARCRSRTSDPTPRRSCSPACRRRSSASPDPPAAPAAVCTKYRAENSR